MLDVVLKVKNGWEAYLVRGREQRIQTELVEKKRTFQSYSPSRWDLFDNIIVPSTRVAGSLTIHTRRIHGFPVRKRSITIQRPLAPEINRFGDPGD